jgi:hypothetical protein
MKKETTTEKKKSRTQECRTRRPPGGAVVAGWLGCSGVSTGCMILVPISLPHPAWFKQAAILG